MAAWIDVPWHYPELVREMLLRPWPQRGFVARLEDRARRVASREKPVKTGQAQDALCALLRRTGMGAGLPSSAG
ncbi:hypothetical protein [Acetobacter fallax]|uniref:hypothetical protein n=1 Tax=Acetobacter fallax TaxID=1737473 RepID=UPI001F557DC6|nr:hypothetical protein [Acetobacter fallax]